MAEPEAVRDQIRLVIPAEPEYGRLARYPSAPNVTDIQVIEPQTMDERGKPAMRNRIRNLGVGLAILCGAFAMNTVGATAGITFRRRGQVLDHAIRQWDGRRRHYRSGW